MHDEWKIQLTEEANQIIRDRIQYIQGQYPRVREAYQNHYDWLELDPLRHEIALCLIFGLFQAAITLTNHLLESLLKYTLIVHHSKKIITPQDDNVIDAMIKGTADAREKFGSADMSYNINALRRTGLITKSQKKDLDELRQFMRNAYSHADKGKTFRDGTIPTKPVHLTTGGLNFGDNVDAKLADFIICQGIAQVFVAEKQAPEYFLYVDSLTRQLHLKIFGGDNDKVV